MTVPTDIPRGDLAIQVFGLAHYFGREVDDLNGLLQVTLDEATKRAHTESPDGRRHCTKVVEGSVVPWGDGGLSETWEIRRTTPAWQVPVGEAREGEVQDGSLLLVPSGCYGGPSLKLTFRRRFVHRASPVKLELRSVCLAAGVYDVRAETSKQWRDRVTAELGRVEDTIERGWALACYQANAVGSQPPMKAAEGSTGGDGEGEASSS